MRIFLTLILLIPFQGSTQEDIQVRYDSLVPLRFGNVIVYHKNKVGVYNTVEHAMIVTMAKNTVLHFTDFGNYDGCIVFHKRHNYITFFSARETLSFNLSSDPHYFYLYSNSDSIHFSQNAEAPILYTHELTLNLKEKSVVVRKGLRPDSCTHIVQVNSGRYIYKTSGLDCNHFYVDANGENRQSLKLYLDKNNKILNPDIVLGPSWDTIIPLTYFTAHDGEKNYFLVVKNSQQTVFEIPQDTAFYPSKPKTELLEFVHYNPEMNLLTTYDHNVLSFYEDDSLVHRQYMSSDSFFYDITTHKFTNGCRNFVSAGNDETPLRGNTNDHTLTFIKTQDRIIINAPYSHTRIDTFHENLPHNSYYQTYSFSSGASNIYERNTYGWAPAMPMQAEIIPYNFGYLVRTPSSIYNTTFILEAPIDKPNPLGTQRNQESKVILLDQYLKPIQVFDFVDFDSVNDLGYGLQIFINDLSFFMTYKGEVISSCQYHEFKMIEGKLIGIRYDDLVNKTTVLQKDVLEQF